jgi:hypothetical protein
MIRLRREFGNVGEFIGSVVAFANGYSVSVNRLYVSVDSQFE